MRTKIVLIVLSTGALTGCAGSANHEVVSAYQAEDNTMVCARINEEIIKTQVIIDGVNKDKDDISGADVVDGILWFPFNLVAKSQNYSDALAAADRRIQNLQTLRRQKNCAAASVQNSNVVASRLSSELAELSQLYKSGAIDAEEYKLAKQRVLGQDYSALSYSPPQSTPSNRTQKEIGVWQYQAEVFAQDSGCLASDGRKPKTDFLVKKGYTEYFEAKCNNQSAITFSCSTMGCKI